MEHLNYHEVAGATPSECGRELGRLFGCIAREYIAEARASGTWADRKRKAEVLLSHTARYFPAYVDELEAYADAARVAVLDLWTMSIEDDLGGELRERCTTIVTNAGSLISHNEDWDADSDDDICILKRTCGSVTTLELYYYACPLGRTALSICSRGYIQAINSLNHTDDQIGVPKLVIARALSELKYADGELGKLLNIPRSSGFAHTLVDRTGMVTAVECTATQQRIWQPGLPFVHTNHMLDPKLANFEDDIDERSTFKRYDSACRLVHAVATADDLVRIAGDQTQGKTNSLLNKNTIARAVIDTDRRTARLWLRREKEKGWVDYSIDFLFGDEAPSA